MIFRCCAVSLTVLCSILVGCRATYDVFDPEYAQVSNAIHASWHSPASSEILNPVPAELEGPHDVETYIRFALDQNPNIHAARKRLESVGYQVAVAASLQDPNVGMTILPEQVQTASGQQELLLTASQRIPWRGKLSTRAELVESQTDVARAQLAAVELAIVDDVKQAYYELYFIQKAIGITNTELKLLVQIRDVANTRYKAGRTSQQDLLRAELEISNVENELIRLRQRLDSAQARLASVLHVAPQSKLRAREKLPPEEIPRDLEQLQRNAVDARPELHALLAAIERDRKAVELAHLDYKPDFTLGATWIDVATAGISPVANGRDSFLLTTGINLPVYRSRLDSSLHSAEAKAVSTAREYDALKDDTLESVLDLFAKVKSQRDLLILFREDILPKARQTLEVSSRAYNVGEVDFLQLIDNWRLLLRYEIANLRLEASLRQTLSQLERLVGGYENLPTAGGKPIVPVPILPKTKPIPKAPPPSKKVKSKSKKAK